MVQNNEFSILLITDNQRSVNLCEGYCYVKGCNLTATSDLIEIRNELEKEQNPLLIILDLGFFQNSRVSEKWSLIRDMLVGHKITVCGSNPTKIPNHLKSNPELEISAFFDMPIEIEVLDKYISNNFMINKKSIIEKRKDSRRSYIDRRNFRNGDRRRLADRRNANGYSVDLKKVLLSEKNKVENVSTVSLIIDNHQKCIQINKRDIALARTEFELLLYLANKEDEVSLNEDIIKFLWPKKTYAARTELHQYVYLLRKKIEEDPGTPKILITVKGYGYRLGCPAIIKD